MGKQAGTAWEILEKTNFIVLIFLFMWPISHPYPRDVDIEPFICPLEKCLVRSTRFFSVDHRAVDIESDIGNPVYAAGSGRIYQAGIDPTTGDAKRIILIHYNGYVTLYWHLNKIVVNARDYIYQGQLIGYSGQTGWASWPHLHFGIIDHKGNYLDPLEFIDMEIQ